VKLLLIAFFCDLFTQLNLFYKKTYLLVDRYLQGLKEERIELGPAHGEPGPGMIKFSPCPMAPTFSRSLSNPLMAREVDSVRFFVIDQKIPEHFRLRRVILVPVGHFVVTG